MTPMTISQLEQAINQARNAAEPQPTAHQQTAAQRANGTDSLSYDLNLLATIYGELIYRGHKGFDVDSLDENSRAAVLRWAPPDFSGRAAA